MKADKSLLIIRKALLSHGESVAVAESVTSGNLQAALCLANEATSFYQGGITVYNLGQKARHLHVDPVAAERTNCVSEDIAQTMAIQVCSLFSSDWGIGVTGYAAPVPEWDVDSPLFAYYAFAHKGIVVHSEKLECPKRSIEKVQNFYTLLILQKFSVFASEFERVAIHQAP